MAERTITLHRVLKAPPERVYRAFLDPEAMCKWLPPKGFVAQVQEMDAREGGRYRMSFRNFGNGQTHAFGGTYLRLVPNETIRYSDHFDDPNLTGEMITTVTLRTVSCGTDLTVTQEGIPALVPLEMCHLGWQESLDQLAALVEPTLPAENF